MNSTKSRSALYLDIFGLFIAGFNNTILALLVAVLIRGPGTISSQPDLALRAAYIADNLVLWKASWVFWFAPTLSFSWSYYALGRNLESGRTWRNLAIGIAIMAAAVDVVGMLLNMTVLPDLAVQLVETAGSQDPTLVVVFQSFEKLANDLTNVGGFGLYTLAGLLILPAAWAVKDFSRLLFVIGLAEWGISAIATILLIVAPAWAAIPLVISFLLYAPWVWGGAIWLWRRHRKTA